MQTGRNFSGQRRLMASDYREPRLNTRHARWDSASSAVSTILTVTVEIHTQIAASYWDSPIKVQSIIHTID